MNNIISETMLAAASCKCGNPHHPIHVKEIVIESGALTQLAPFLTSQSIRNTLIVADELTFQAAGTTVMQHLNQNQIHNSLCLIHPDNQGDVKADEVSLIQTLMAVNSNTEAIIAIGSGTIHDIVRFISSKLHLPFISVPTAASVDGFTSAGAPLIIRGMKQTIQAAAPIAVFADIDVLISAPKQMNASGFGDMLGKFTSLADWKVSHLLADEPYCPLAAKITKQSLDNCLNNIDKIRTHSPEGLRILMAALIESGLVMLMIDHSRPASGAEHHLSHFWEMHLIENHMRQLLHGAKVGVATGIIADLYHRLANILQEELHNSIEEQKREFVSDRWKEVREALHEIPPSTALRDWLRCVGGPSTIEELGISEELLQQALNQAHKIRNRHTGLRLINENPELNKNLIKEFYAPNSQPIRQSLE